MISDAERTQRDLWEARQGAASSIEGDVTAVDFASGVATVNVGGVSRVVPWAGPAPFVGARVRVVKAGQQSVCFVSGQGASYGEVLSTGTGVVTVTGDDGSTYTYPHEFGAAFSAGQRVVMDHARQVVLFRLSNDPSALDSGVLPSAPSGARVTKSFRPTYSGNWYSSAGRWDSLYPEISITRSGYYFYGTQIEDSIPDSATIITARIELRELWDNVSGVPSQMGTHGYANRPGAGPLALTGSVNVSGSGSHALTATMANALKTGAAYGVGFAQNTGWRRFDTYLRSGTITITWET